MTDLPSELSRARELFREIAPPLGARSRIYCQIRAQRAQPSRQTRSWVAVALLALVATSAAAFSLGVMSDQRAPGANSAGPSDSVGSSTRPRTARRARLRPRGSSGPSAMPVRSPAEIPVVLPQAIPSAAPNALPSRGTPREGMASNSRKLQAPRFESRSDLPSVGSLPPEPLPSSSAVVLTGPSDLSLQVAAYREAVGLASSSPGEALGQLRAFRARWPGSALGHEVDLRIIQALLTLGRIPEAQGEARSFLRRHPESPRRADLTRLAESSESPTSPSNN